MLIISDSNSNVANDALSAENGSKRIAHDAFFEHSNNEMKKNIENALKIVEGIKWSTHTLGCFLAYSRLTHEYGKSERRTMQKYGKDKKKYETCNIFEFSIL